MLRAPIGRPRVNYVELLALNMTFTVNNSWLNFEFSGWRDLAGEELSVLIYFATTAATEERSGNAEIWRFDLLVDDLLLLNENTNTSYLDGRPSMIIDRIRINGGSTGLAFSIAVRGTTSTNPDRLAIAVNNTSRKFFPIIFYRKEYQF